MKLPVNGNDEWLVVDSVDSTQRLAAQCLREDRPVGAIMALEQTQGVGRFGRPWFSQPGDSLMVSFIFREYADHPKPYLISMAFALATAGALHCQVRWPNDLVIGERKVAGVIAELLPDSSGRRVPVIGIGVNLNQTEFPEEVSDRAISLRQAHGKVSEARDIAEKIVARLKSMPEPDEWSDLYPIWMLFDRTPGKRYRLASGEESVAIGVGSGGQLLCSVEGESRSVLAAEALFGAD